METEELYRNLVSVFKSFKVDGILFTDLYGDDVVKSMLCKFADSIENMEKSFTEMSVSIDTKDRLVDVLSKHEIDSMYVHFMYHYYTFLRTSIE